MQQPDGQPRVDDRDVRDGNPAEAVAGAPADDPEVLRGGRCGPVEPAALRGFSPAAGPHRELPDARRSRTARVASAAGTGRSVRNVERDLRREDGGRSERGGRPHCAGPTKRDGGP